MPVSVLYCEGNSSSVDLRVLSLLVPVGCRVQGIGSKFGFREKVIADRYDRSEFLTLSGLNDRDFDDFYELPQEQPIRVFDREQKHIGWRWERQEIENYLLDPTTVRQALGKKAPPDADYCEALSKAAEKTSAYTAARAALAFYCFPNSWGRKRAKTLYFPEFDQLGQRKCEEKIAEIVREKLKVENRVLKPDLVVNKFRDLLQLYRSGGLCFQNNSIFSLAKIFYTS